MAIRTLSTAAVCVCSDKLSLPGSEARRTAHPWSPLSTEVGPRRPRAARRASPTHELATGAEFSIHSPQKEAAVDKTLSPGRLS